MRDSASVRAFPVRTEIDRCYDRFHGNRSLRRLIGWPLTMRWRTSARLGIGLYDVALCRDDERADGCPPLCTAIGAGDQVFLAPSTSRRGRLEVPPESFPALFGKSSTEGARRQCRLFINIPEVRCRAEGTLRENRRSHRSAQPTDPSCLRGSHLVSAKPPRGRCTLELLGCKEQRTGIRICVAFKGASQPPPRHWTACGRRILASLRPMVRCLGYSRGNVG